MGKNCPPPLVGNGLIKNRDEVNCPPVPSVLFTTLQVMYCNGETSFLLMDNAHFHALVFSRNIFWNTHIVTSCWMLLLKRFQPMHCEPYAYSVFYTIHINIGVWNVIGDWKYVWLYYLFGPHIVSFNSGQLFLVNICSMFGSILKKIAWNLGCEK